MSGSLSWQVYTSDLGVDFAILCDKSNVLAVNASASATPGTLPSYSVPRSIIPRYANYRSDDGLVNRKVPLLKLSDVAALTSASSFTPTGTSTVVKLRSIVGEKARLPKLTDTGLTT